MMTISVNSLFEKKLLMPGWGEIALASLLLAMVSGFLLIPAYISGPEPFKSITIFISLSSIGHFLHSFHSYCGDLFLIATIIHTIEYLIQKTHRSYLLKSWINLVLLLLISFLVVFSGFLSMGSKESFSAIHILNTLLQILAYPGQLLSDFFLQLNRSETPLAVVYTHHAATFTLLTLYLTYIHIRRLKAESYAFLYSIVIISLIALLFPASIGHPPESVIPVVKGPWYFIGFQELLGWMPPLIGGIIFPLIIMALLAMLPILWKYDKYILMALTLLFIFYLIESIIGFFFRGSGWLLLNR